MVQFIYFCIYLFIFIFGVCIGSFLNVVIYRLPLGIMFKSERSYCPNCQVQIKNYDLIPLLSFIFLKGKCRACGKKISARYPLVELIVGISAVISIYKFNYSAKAFGAFAFCCLLISLSLIKYDKNKVPISLCILLVANTIISIFLFKEITIFDRLIPCIPVFALFVIGAITKNNMKVFFFLLLNVFIFLGLKQFVSFYIILSIITIIIYYNNKNTSDFKYKVYNGIYIAFIITILFGKNIFELLIS